MKKIISLAVAALLICGAVMGQQPEEKKKKGGFLNAVKKGVESTTGLRVSDETLFVYPEKAAIGEWKMVLESCEGNPATGEVVLKIKATKLMGNPYKNTWSIIKEAVVTGTKEPLMLERRSADPLQTYEVNRPVEMALQRILDVPTDAKFLDVKFYISDRDYVFEARRVPIEWLGAE